MKKIIFDTNFLIDCFRFRVDFLKEIEENIEKPYEFFVVNLSLKELESIAKTRKKEAKYARIALAFLKKNCKVVFIKAKNADQGILKISDENTVVATNDKQLRKNLKRLKIKNIYLKSMKKIGIG
ncbi:MAG: PIN domain-containing protein [Candidatus Aenigmatarchaeota archaeon]